MNNMILLKHLMEIASTKRVDDGVRVRSASSNAGRRKNIDWRDFLEQILNMRRQQVSISSSFYEQLLQAKIPKAQKIESSCQFFVLLGSAFNFINVFSRVFYTKFWRQKLYKAGFCKILGLKFWRQKFCTKNTRVKNIDEIDTYLDE